ncbi:MAG: ABC transporter permease [Planctomycetes bacterium]|nr:ABC transporter permease [Planctomycetota bacterium]
MSADDRHTLRRLVRHRGVQIGVAIVALWVLLAALATPLTGYDHSAFDPDTALDYQNVPPSWWDRANLPPDVEARTFLAGTDDLGHDMFGLVLYGTRYSLTIGFLAVAISLLVGIPLGLVSGYFGGWLDTLIMRSIDVVMAFPTILLAICIVTVLGQSLVNLMVAVGLVGVPGIARQLRAEVLRVKQLEFVQAAQALGFGNTRILFGHVFPNCLAPIIVLATLSTATAILETAGLGFVGLGPEPGTPEWGLIISENRNLLTQAPWAVLTPGVAIVILVLGFNLLGDGLRDVLDPRLKKR